MQEFLRLTENILKQDVEAMYHRYFYERKFDRKNYDDFNLMKEEATPIFDKIEKWEKDANQIVHKLPLFPNQIKNTLDNLEIMILHSYFNDVRKKRFMELYQSVKYNMNLILDEHMTE
ncbi:DUF1798 family protein [Tenuibacillus multivorans]|uniref:DUF1798 family protein n=1 Tax=Tenuibacillus multivorans TaxID=237069 RepID=A0A1H0CS51_9BACI|nr:DUF1798 family protein [Tenuibacillus multivorans]SDN60541.1 protein of unknown function [Tenuibacillus multivorans]